MNNHKLGLVVGAFFGLWHIAWSLAVAFGVANRLLTTALHLHFLSPSYTVLPFDASGAILLVVISVVGGYVIGWVFAALWNWVKD